MSKVEIEKINIPTNEGTDKITNQQASQVKIAPTTSNYCNGNHYSEIGSINRKSADAEYDEIPNAIISATQSNSNIFKTSLRMSSTTLDISDYSTLDDFKNDDILVNLADHTQISISKWQRYETE